jgi:hypothetical protein
MVTGRSAKSLPILGSPALSHVACCMLDDNHIVGSGQQIAPTASKVGLSSFLISNAHLPFFFSSFFSFFPPLSISKWPAFSASIFSVCPTRPAELLCLILFCEMRDAFFGLITRAPGLVRFPLAALSACYNIYRITRSVTEVCCWFPNTGRRLKKTCLCRLNSLLGRRGLGLCLDYTLSHCKYEGCENQIGLDVQVTCVLGAVANEDGT